MRRAVFFCELRPGGIPAAVHLRLPIQMPVLKNIKHGGVVWSAGFPSSSLNRCRLSMPNFNRIFLIGNLTHAAPTTETAAGAAVTNFSTASNEKYRKTDGGEGERVCFVDVVTWDTLVQQCAESLKKGSLVFVEGRLDYSKTTGCAL